MTEVPKEITQIFYPEEIIIWHETPNQGLVFYNMLLVRIAIMFFVLLISLFAFILMTQFESASILLTVASLLLFVAAISYAVALPFLEARARSHTHYAITNRRIIIFREGRRGGQLDTVNFHEIKNLRLMEWRDGVGTIFINSLRRYSPHWFGPRPLFDNGRELDLISDVKAVYDLIRKAQIDAERKT